MKKKNILIATVGLIVVGSLVVNGLGNKKMPVIEEAQSIPVKTEKINISNMQEEVYAIGEVMAEKVFYVNPVVNGEISDIYVSVGDQVEKDQVLYKVDMTEFNLDINSQSLQLSNNLEIVKEQYELAEKNYKDTKQLFEQDAVSEYQMDQAETQLESAKVNYENVENSYQTMLASTNEKSDYYIIKSPTAGIVTAKTIEEGMVASPQSGVTIMASETLIVQSSVATKNINNVEIGQEVSIAIGESEDLLGEVIEISYASENGSFPIKVMISESTEMIKPGMYTEMRIITNDKQSVLIAPINAIINVDDETYIYKVEDNRAIKEIVKKGIMQNGYVEIEGSIAAGDEIITIGKEMIKEDIEILIVE